MKRRAVVIFSGGQDSTTCLNWAKNRFDYLEAITFDYGQNHAVEIKASKRICKQLKIKQTIIDLSFLQTIIDSAMLTNESTLGRNEKGLPKSFVPNRNQIFITLAHAYAQKIGAEHIVIGACQTDNNGYPDCRLAYINSIERATNTGSQSKIFIHTPLMDLTKAETFQLARHENCLKQVIKESHTCYNGNRDKLHEWGYGCGKCQACIERKNGYYEAKEQNLI